MSNQKSNQVTITIDLNDFDSRHIEPKEIPTILKQVNTIRDYCGKDGFNEEQLIMSRLLHISQDHVSHEVGEKIDSFFFGLSFFTPLLK